MRCRHWWEPVVATSSRPATLAAIRLPAATARPRSSCRRRPSSVSECSTCSWRRTRPATVANVSIGKRCFHSVFFFLSSSSSVFLYLVLFLLLFLLFLSLPLPLPFPLRLPLQSINQSINLYRAIVQRRVLQCSYAESKRNVLRRILNVLTDGAVRQFSGTVFLLLLFFFFLLLLLNSSTASPKPLADQLGYWIRMHLSFKPNVTCRPTRNLWFLNVFSTFRLQNSVVKKLAVGRGALEAGRPPMV